jgi:thioredoxin reductase (NADPH)
VTVPNRAIVVGAGPAGYSACLWLHDLKVPFVWLDQTGQIGGTLRRVGNAIHNWAGRSFASGIALADDMAAHADSLGVACVGGWDIGRVDPEDGGWSVHGSTGSLSAAQVLLATGTRPRPLDVPGVGDWQGRGLEISVTRTRDSYRDLPVCVVGGGDAALEGALLLAEVTSEVHLVHRATSFRGQPRFVAQVLGHPHIVVHTGRRVSELRGSGTDGRLTGVVLDDGHELHVRGIFVRIGVEPSVPDSGVHFPRTGGYLDPARSGELLPGLWCAGDVSDGQHQSAIWAAGQGARAAWGIAASLGYVSSVGSAASPGRPPSRCQVVGSVT